jgi:hypothetical protein
VIDDKQHAAIRVRPKRIAPSVAPRVPWCNAMVRAMNNNEAKAKWDRIIAKRNAELERKMRDDPELARRSAGIRRYIA